MAQVLHNPSYDNNNIGHTYQILDPRFTGVMDSMTPMGTHQSNNVDQAVELSSIYLAPSVTSPLPLLTRDSGIACLLSDGNLPIYNISSDFAAVKSCIYLSLIDGEDLLPRCQDGYHCPDQSQRADTECESNPGDHLMSIFVDDGAFTTDDDPIKTSMARNCMPDVVQASFYTPLVKDDLLKSTASATLENTSKLSNFSECDSSL